MDLFIILGLEHGASEGEIRRAYRRLARRFHPDINPGDRVAEARFREILDAYETLIDPERRSRYEAGQPPASAGDAPGSGFEGFDFSKTGAEHAVTFGDLFGEVPNAHGPRSVRSVRRRRQYAVGARAHGLHPAVHRLRRHRPAAPAGVRVVRGIGIRDPGWYVPGADSRRRGGWRHGPRCGARL